MFCSKCDEFVCPLCLTNITTCIGDKLGETDGWYRNMRQFLQDGTLSPDFIGHCCEFKVLGHQCPISDATIESRFDGHMFCPKFQLLANSPFTCVDIHGLGAIKDHTPGAWNSVLSHSTSVLCHQKICVP